jgi:hypothetical protein
MAYLHQFGPNASGKTYVCLAKHRNKTPGASQWTVQPAIEYEMFCDADAADSVDLAGNYWSVRDGGREIGTRNERIAKHPATSNSSDPWHGYPASPAYKGAGDMPADNVIDNWRTAGSVSRSFVKRLKRRQF